MKKITVVILSLALLFSSLSPAFAGQDNAQKFQTAREQLSEPEADSILKVVGIAGVVTFGLLTAAVLPSSAYAYFNRLLLADAIDSYNVFTEELRRIGVPDQYMGQLGFFTQASFDDYKALYENILEVEDLSTKLSQQTRISTKEFDANCQQLLSLQEDILRQAREFKMTYPNLVYTHEYNYLIPKPLSYTGKSLMIPFTIRGAQDKKSPNSWTVQSKDGKLFVTEGKYKGMPVEVQGTGCFIRITPHNKAIQKQYLKSLRKGASKTAVVGAPLLALGLILDAAQASAQDEKIAERLQQNPALAFAMSDEEADFIAQNADAFPQTIEIYSQYAQIAARWNSLTEEEQAQVQKQIEQQTEKVTATKLVQQELTKHLRSGLAH